MCLENNIDGWRYKCPFCESRAIKGVNDKKNRGTQKHIPRKWKNVPHYRCGNNHRFLSPVDMATKEFRNSSAGVKSNVLLKRSMDVVVGIFDVL